MARFTISPYVIKVKEKRTQNYYHLGNLPNNDDLYGRLVAYLGGLQDKYIRNEPAMSFPSHQIQGWLLLV